MSNPLIQSRDAFAAGHPEKRITLNGREWGYIDVGQGPVLLLIPGTLGRCDVFWQQIEALKAQIAPLTPGAINRDGDVRKVAKQQLRRDVAEAQRTLQVLGHT